MHLVAEFADLQTLRFLAKCGLKHRNINRTNKAGLASINIALQRSDIDSEWNQAFIDFLKSIDETQLHEGKGRDAEGQGAEGSEALPELMESGDEHPSSEDEFKDAAEYQV